MQQKPGYPFPILSCRFTDDVSARHVLPGNQVIWIEHESPITEYKMSDSAMLVMLSRFAKEPDLILVRSLPEDDGPTSYSFNYRESDTTVWLTINSDTTLEAVFEQITNRRPVWTI